MILDQFAEGKGWLTKSSNANANSNSDGTIISILKVDVERYEAFVLSGARRLIQARMIRNVFTETSRVAVENDEELQRQTLRLLVDAGYRLAGQGGYAGPGREVMWEQGPTLPDAIIGTLKEVEKKQSYFNLWWTIDDDLHLKHILR